MSKDKLFIAGEKAFNDMDKINCELFTMTYGSLVVQLIKDYEDVKVVNEQLDKIGHNIGKRIIDEYLSKSPISSCKNFKNTGEVIAKVAFKMFLGINAEDTNWNDDNDCFYITFQNNPLEDFVELPEEYNGLDYSNILCGIIRGALSMIQLKVECQMVKSQLKGGNYTEIQVKLIGKIHEKIEEDE